MADNVAITAGAGTSIATDDIGGVQYQRVKLTFGVDGAAADVSATDPLPVTGALTDTQLRATPVPVSGTVTITPSGTQTVSGTVTANAGTGTFAVSAASLPLPTGAATSAKQDTIIGHVDGIEALLGGTLAVSGPLTDTQLRATPVPVSGTFYQATQPVSGTVTANAGTGTFAVSLATLPALVAGTALVGKVGLDQTTPGTTNAVSVAQVGSTTVATGNGVVGTGVQRVAIASDNTAFAVNATLQAGTAGIGKLTSNAGVTIGAVEIASAQTLATVTTVSTVTNLSQLGGQAVAMNTGTRSAGTQRVTIATDDLVPVSPPTLTKATQGSTGFSVQDLKDAGRTTLAMTAEFAHAQTAETLLTMTLSSNSAATSTFSSRVITSGKRLRLQSAIIQVEILGSGTAPQRAYLRMRANTAGSTSTSSPLQWILPVGATQAIVKSSNWASMDFPDGFELAGDGTATFGFTLETPDWVNTTATGRSKITIIGFEY